MLMLHSCVASKKAPPLPEAPDFLEVLEEDTVIYDKYVFDVQDTINPIFVLVSLERMHCYGECPEYSAEFFSNGRILFRGFKNVDKLGDYEAFIDRPTVAKIRAMAERIGYFNLQEFYPAYGAIIDDFPITVTYVNFIFKENTVTNIHSSPVRLHKFERLLDEVLGVQEWKLIEKGENK